MKDITFTQLRSLLEKESTGEKRLDAVYVYSPICGTCKLGERMLNIVQQTMPDLEIYQLDLNLSPDAALTYQIESIPCLLVWPRSRTSDEQPDLHYALHSVTHLFSILGEGING